MLQAPMIRRVETKKWLFACMLLLLWSKSDGARILAIGAMPSYSHHIVFDQIWRELLLRGHEVVLMTVSPINDPNLTNLTEIDWSYAYDMKNQKTIIDMFTGKTGVWELFPKFIEFSVAVHTYQLKHPEVQKIIHDKSQHFDLVMFEFLAPVFGAFAHRFKCPCIGVQSMELTPEMYSFLGNPPHPAIFSHLVFPFYRNFTFFERLISSLFQFVLEVFLMPVTLRTNTALIRKYFGEDYPDISEIINNVDMVFHNVNPVFRINKPVVPALVEFGGGLQIRPLKPLPKDIKIFLDAAKNGIVYFSLGSNVISEFIDDEMRSVILETFASLPYSILWKFEVNNLNVSNNVKILKWVPQQDILRHPKIKLFISQCGLQSLEEAMYSHVPVVCIPFVADQFRNSRMTSDIGIGVRVGRDTLTIKNFKTAILEVIDNPKYKEKMAELARLSKDQPMTGIEKVIWWTEYVIRNKGAKNLRSALKDVPFYQYYLLDVVGFIVVVLSALLFVIFKITKYLCKISKKLRILYETKPSNKDKIK